MSRAHLPSVFASHHVAAFDPTKFAQIESERRPFTHIGVDGELGHAGFDALGPVYAVHHFVLAPGLVDVGNFGEAEQFVKGDGLVEVGNHAAVKLDADDLALAGAQERLRRSARRPRESDARECNE